jgi:hypothetical protein
VHVWKGGSAILPPNSRSYPHGNCSKEVPLAEAAATEFIGHSPLGRRKHRRPQLDPASAAELDRIIRTAKLIIDDSEEENERLVEAIREEMRKW